MIKQAEVQNAYLLGRQAAMEKLANMSPAGPLAEGEDDVLTGDEIRAINEYNASLGEYNPLHEEGMEPATMKERLMGLAGDANQLRQAIGLGGRGLSRNQQNPAFVDQYAAYNPMNYATLENLSRAGMLGGAIGGSALGGFGLGSSAAAGAGALGGGLAGGALGQALSSGLDAYRLQGINEDLKRKLQTAGGALGGLAGGLGAGYAAR